MEEIQELASLSKFLKEILLVMYSDQESTSIKLPENVLKDRMEEAFSTSEKPIICMIDIFSNILASNHFRTTQDIEDMVDDIIKKAIRKPLLALILCEVLPRYGFKNDISPDEFEKNRCYLNSYINKLSYYMKKSRCFGLQVHKHRGFSGIIEDWNNNEIQTTNDRATLYQRNIKNTILHLPYPWLLEAYKTPSAKLS